MKSFTEFAKSQLNSGIKSARQIAKNYRQYGGKVSNQRATDIVRDLKGGSYNVKKNTRGFLSKKQLKQKHGKTMHIPDARYIYVVSNNIEDSDGNIKRKFITIAWNDRLTDRQLQDLAYIKFIELFENIDHYSGLSWVDDDSFKVEYRVDMSR